MRVGKGGGGGNPTCGGNACSIGIKHGVKIGKPRSPRPVQGVPSHLSRLSVLSVFARSGSCGPWKGGRVERVEGGGGWV